MNESHSSAIVLLLAAILCVMLFGAGAVLSGLWWIAIAGAILVAVFLVIALVAHLYGSVTEARSEGRAWLYLLVGIPALIANFAAFCVAYLEAWSDGSSAGNALDDVPYAWIAPILLIASMVVAAIETAPGWLPKVPRKISALLHLWFALLVGPYMGPMGRWRAIRKRRAQGERVGAFSAGLSIVGVFTLSICLWLIAVYLPLAIAIGIFVAVSS